MSNDRSAEAILLGSADRCLDVNLTRLAPAVGSSASTLSKWRKYGFPEQVRIFARICRERHLTREQAGALLEQIK